MNVEIAIVSQLAPKQIQILNHELAAALSRHELLYAAPEDLETFYEAVNRELITGKCMITLALMDKKIVGSLYALFDSPTTASLHKLIVNPTYRGQGIATKLFRAMETAIKQTGRTRVIFDYYEGNPAAHLYETLGYTIKHKEKSQSKPDLLSIEVEKHLK